MKYRVIEAHRGPDRPPLTLRKGDHVTVGETYKGPEGWPDWAWCVSDAGIGAWVPLPFLETFEKGAARALADYSSRELDAEEGDEVTGARETCGWVWCFREHDGTSGWVPREKLEPRP
jgi:hypothetical protein